MTCQCCRCGHCAHPASFRPFHRPPSPSLPNNTLILPSTASAIDAPLHITGKKRAYHDRDSNRTSPALLEALHWTKEAADEKEREAKAGEPERAAENADWSSDEQRPNTASAPSCRCECHTEVETALTAHSEFRPASALVPSRSAARSGAPLQQSALVSPRSSNATHSKRQKADTTAATTATPRNTAMHGSRPASSRSTKGRQLQVHTPLNTDTAIFRGAIAPSPIPTHHTPPTPHDNKYDDDTVDGADDDDGVDAAIEANRAEARARSLQKKAKADAITAADTARRDKLEAAFQASQAKRAQQLRADDKYYGDMLQRQYERRVKMDFFRTQFESNRRTRRLADGTDVDRAVGGGGLSRPVFVDFGGRNTRSSVEGERLLSFNILPDLPPNAPQQPQSYNSARKAAVERLRQKQLVVKRVKAELEEDGVEAAGDGQSEYDRKVASLAQRQRVQQQQQHHAQRMAAATHKPQRSSRPSTAERSAAVGSEGGSAYVPLLPLPIEPMASASQASYASFRPPSSQSVKLQRQRW